MANEITISARVIVKNGQYSYDNQVAGAQFDQTTAAGGNPGIVEIGTAEEDVSFGDLVSPAIVLMRNQSTANFVQFGAKDASGNMQAIGRLRPKGVALFELEPGATLRMKADTAACKVLIHAQDL